MFHLQRWNNSLKHSRPVRWNLKILLYFATCVSHVIITMQCIDQLLLLFYSVSFIPITRKRSDRREIYRFKGQLRQRARECKFQWIVAIDEFPRISRQVRFMEVEETRKYRPFPASLVENSLLCQNFRNENEIFARSQYHVYHTRQRGFSIATIIDRTQPHYDAGHSWVIDQPSVLTTT